MYFHEQALQFLRGLREQTGMVVVCLPCDIAIVSLTGFHIVYLL
jgi:hypothetical protein